MSKRFIILPIVLLASCKPDSEKIYERNFALRAARELESIGDETGARRYLDRALTDSAARGEAQAFINRIAERRVRAPYCVEEKKTDLAINQYPGVRHKHLFQMAVCLEAAGDDTKALGTYNLAETSGGKQPQLYIRRAYLNERRGAITDAARDLNRAVALNAGYPPAQLALALFEIRQGRPENADVAQRVLADKKPFYAEIIADARGAHAGK